MFVEMKTKRSFTNRGIVSTGCKVGATGPDPWGGGAREQGKVVTQHSEVLC